jgi:hypothetical protein
MFAQGSEIFDFRLACAVIITHVPFICRIYSLFPEKFSFGFFSVLSQRAIIAIAEEAGSLKAAQEPNYKKYIPVNRIAVLKRNCCDAVPCFHLASIC